VITYKTFSNSSALLGAVCAPAGMLCPIFDTSRKVWSHWEKNRERQQKLSSFIKVYFPGKPERIGLSLD